VVKATFDALISLKDVGKVAEQRGRTPAEMGVRSEAKSDSKPESKAGAAQ
jgi:hypothetical protein